MRGNQDWDALVKTLREYHEQQLHDVLHASPEQLQVAQGMARMMSMLLQKFNE